MDRGTTRQTPTSQWGNSDQFRAFDAPPSNDLPESMRIENGVQSKAHGGHSWLHWLMCLPMLLIVGYQVLTGAVGGGSLFYALGCVAMMAVMMRVMNHGGGNNSGHRH